MPLLTESILSVTGDGSAAEDMIDKCCIDNSNFYISTIITRHEDRRQVSFSL